MIKNILFLIILFFSPLNIKAAETNFTLEITGSNITPTPESSSTSTSSNPPGPPVCNDSKPKSAPTLLSATAGIDSVTLIWEKALDPVTHYLLAYGTVSGEIKFGSPNIGDQNTTGYTVKGLVKGNTYYFRIKAVNGCMPGDFSNEVSAKPISSKINPISILEEISITPIPTETLSKPIVIPTTSPLFDISTQPLPTAKKNIFLAIFYTVILGIIIPLLIKPIYKKIPPLLDKFRRLI